MRTSTIETERPSSEMQLNPISILPGRPAYNVDLILILESAEPLQRLSKNRLLLLKLVP